MEAQQQKVITLWITAAIMHTVDSAVKLLDQSPSAVDDQFLGCREKMLQKVLGKEGLLQEEIKANAMFSQAWGTMHCPTPKSNIPTSKPEHSMALGLYTKGGPAFRQAFDDAMQSHGGGVAAYQGFQFKALHFLLTDALRILRPKTCITVFHESGDIFQARVGDKVRFGKFFTAISGKTEDVEDLVTGDTGTLFNITSCAVVNVGDYACYPEDFDLLVPPFEEFLVVKVMDNVDQRIIFLNHTRLYSNHDCVFFGSSNDPVTPTVPGNSSGSVGSSMLLMLAALFLCW